MADSWEDDYTPPPVRQQPPSQQQRGGLNPNASTFSFNPGANSFAPPSAYGHSQFVQPAPPGFIPPQYYPAQPVASSAPPPPPNSQPPPPPRPVQPARPAQVQQAELASDRSGAAGPSQANHVGNHTAANGPAAGAPGQVDRVAEELESLKVGSSSAPEQAEPATEKKSPDKERESTLPSSTQPPSSTAAGKDEEEEETEDEAAIARREEELKQIYEELSKEDPREHMNVVFIGHVDAGKSTTGGQILYLTGGVDERTIQKYEKEAKDKNRESWYMAYIMDTNEEERAKGKTVEVGRAHFTTEKKRYTILDAPGHKNYVPNMIAGAAQADVGVLVIAARKGEFETGFERGGQTREHAQLAKTLGVAKLIVAVNKMDDPSVINEDGTWSEARYNEIVTGLTPFLRSCGYNPKKDVIFLPMSGLLGHNIKDRAGPSVAPWYKGGSLFEVLDNTDPLPRDPLGPFRMSVIDKYKDMGTIAMGKSEAGIVRKGDKLYVMPNKQLVQVASIYQDDNEVNAAKGGENLRLRLTGVDEEEMQSGFVICSRHVPVPCVTYFDAQLQLLDLLEHKSIFTAGYKAVLHIHSLVEECEITRLLAALDLRTRPPTKKKAKFVKGNSAVIVRIEVEKPICIELFENVPQLGRFTLRDEGRTIAIGKVVKLPKSLKEGAPEAK